MRVFLPRVHQKKNREREQHEQNESLGIHYQSRVGMVSGVLRGISAVAAQAPRTLHKLNNFRARLRGASRSYGSAGTHNQIDPAEGDSMNPKCLTRQPFAKVSGRRIGNKSFVNRNPQTATRAKIRLGVDLKKFARHRTLVCKDRSERVPSAETLHPRKRISGARARQTPRRERPFARRVRSTARPPRVFMRTRNPCVRLRRVVDG
jgi:hypothetical protein